MNPLTTYEIAVRLGVTTSAVRRMLHDGRLHGYKVQTGPVAATWLVQESELQAALDEGRISAEETRGRPRHSAPPAGR